MQVTLFGQKLEGGLTSITNVIMIQIVQSGEIGSSAARYNIVASARLKGMLPQCELNLEHK